MDRTETYRQSVKELIELLSSKEQQLQYQSSLSVGDPAAELVCMWFDDTYHPESDLFNSAFSPIEAKVLASFNKAYSDKINKLSGTLDEYHKTKEWAEVMTCAKSTLESIQW